VAWAAVLSVAAVASGADARPGDPPGYGLRLLLPTQCTFPDPDSSDCRLAIGDEIVVIRVRDGDMAVDDDLRDRLPDGLPDLAVAATQARLDAPPPDVELRAGQVAPAEAAPGADGCARFAYETRAPARADALTWSTVTGLRCLEHHPADGALQDVTVTVTSYRAAETEASDTYRRLAGEVLASFEMR
jgi:hypothetical protein